MAQPWNFAVDTADLSLVEAGYPAVAPPRRKPKEVQTKNLPSAVSRLRPYLAGGGPGIWASDHLAELNHATGWNFIAVRALAKGAAQADMTVSRQIADEKKPPRNPAETRKQFRKRLHNMRTKGAPASATGSKPNTHPVPDKHPLVKLLRKPNPGQSGATFRFQIAQQMGLTGTALVWIVRNGLGVPVEMYIIPTGVATPQPPSSNCPKGSYWIAPLANYAVSPDADGFGPVGALGSLMTAGGILDARQVKAIRWPHPLYLSDGLSPLSAGALMVDMAEQLDRASWSSMKNSSSPGLVFETAEDANPSEDEKQGFRDDLRARNSGTGNTGRDLIVPPGLTARQLARTNVEMDYANTRPQARDGVLALQGVPPIAAGITEAGSYSAFYASLKQHTELTIQPMLDLIAEELTEELCPAFGKGLDIALKAKAIDDPQLEDGRKLRLVMAKAITKDELRAMDDMPPMEDGRGKVLAGDPDPQPAAAPGGAPAGGDAAGGGDPMSQLMAGLNGKKPPNGEQPDETPAQAPEQNGKADPFADLMAGLKGEKPGATSTGVRNPAKDAVPGRPTKGLPQGLGEMAGADGGFLVPRDRVKANGNIKSRLNQDHWAKPHEFAMAMVELPEPLVSRLRGLVQMIPESALVEDGRPDRFHVTLLHGL